LRTVVTGGAGFIGSAIARGLLDRGDEVLVIDDLSNGRQDSVPEGAEFIQQDINEQAGLSRAFRGAAVVFHQAALRSVPRSVEEPLVVHKTNTTGTLNVLIAAESAGAERVVYASSSSAYGGVDEGRRSVETDPPSPLSPYAVSKLTAEYYCRVWTEIKGLSTVSLRYFNVFGPGQRADSKYAAVFPAFIAHLISGEPPEIQWDGEQSRDFTYIDDVVAANLAAADSSSDVDGEVFNVASGSPRTINEIYASICDALGVEIEPKRAPRRAGDVRRSYADISKARSLLHWEPTSDWDKAVEMTVQWFRSGLSS
jgi:nucleoside-diphosphate-sugar epimerase